MTLNTELILMLVTIVLILMVILLAKIIFINNKSIPTNDEVSMPLWKEIAYHKFYIDEIYETIIIKPINRIHPYLIHCIEQSGIDAVCKWNWYFSIKME